MPRLVISPRFVALLVAKNGTSNSMLGEFGLTPLASAIKIADRGSHLIDQFCELRRSEIMLGSKLNAGGLMSLCQRNQSGSIEVFGIGKTERHDTTKGDPVAKTHLRYAKHKTSEFTYNPVKGAFSF